MALINPTFPPDSESSIFGWLSGIGQAILGRGNRYYFNRNPQWKRLGDKTVLMDVSYGNLIRVAKCVPHLNVVISQGAKMFSNAQIRHLNRDGEPIENSPVLKLLRKPSPGMTQRKFLYQFYIQNAVYRDVFLFQNKGLSMMQLPSYLWVLPSGEIKVNLTGKLYRQTDIEGIVESYEMPRIGERFEPKEIIHLSEGITENGITSTSPIESLELPLSNIVAALKSKNIILSERGLIGFISSDVSDSEGGRPMNKKERERVEKQYQGDRSLDSRSSHVTFTEASVKWVPMTFDMAQLQLNEGLEPDFAQICGMYGIDRHVFPSKEGATYENKKQGVIDTYQNALQPLADTLMEALAMSFNLPEGETLKAFYDHLPIMKTDEQKKAQTLSAQTTAIAQLVTANIINPAQAQELLTQVTMLVANSDLASGNPIIEKLTELSPLVANNMLGNLTINEVRDILGLPAIPGGDQLAKTSQEKPKPASQTE